MKKKIFITVLIISFGVNLFLCGKLYVQNAYIPNEKENIILSEMIKNTIDSEEYKKIAKKEKIISIDSSIDKIKGGVFPYNMEVFVNTDKQSYIFSCYDETCSKMVNEGWTYSIYEDEKSRLPLKK